MFPYHLVTSRALELEMRSMLASMRQSLQKVSAPPVKHVIDRRSANTRGIVTMLAATAAFEVGNAIMKFQSGSMPLGQSIFLRGIMMCALVTMLLYLGGSMPRRRDLYSPALLWRTLCDSAATFFFVAALARVPLADAGAIIQVNPLIVMAGAALFLGERIDGQRWTAVVVGFVGVLLIIQPGLAGFSWASLLVMGAALTSAARDLITRQLAGMAPLVVHDAPEPQFHAIRDLGVAIAPGFLASRGCGDERDPGRCPGGRVDQFRGCLGRGTVSLFVDFMGAGDRPGGLGLRSQFADADRYRRGHERGPLCFHSQTIALWASDG
jgi:hypothetical protein